MLRYFPQRLNLLPQNAAMLPFFFLTFAGEYILTVVSVLVHEGLFLLMPVAMIHSYHSLSLLPHVSVFPSARSHRPSPQPVAARLLQLWVQHLRLHVRRRLYELDPATWRLICYIFSPSVCLEVCTLAVTGLVLMLQLSWCWRWYSSYHRTTSGLHWFPAS